VEDQTGVPRQVLIRDLAVLQVKLLADGVKDVVLVQLALAAAVLDLLVGGRKRGRFFYPLLRVSERFDLWLNLHSAAEAAAGRSREGLMAPTPRGADSLLSKIESLVQLALRLFGQWYRGRKRPADASAGARRHAV
jgi:hypothetical protein